MIWFSRLPAQSRGILYMLISVIVFSSMYMTAKLLGERVDLSQVLWARYGGQLLLLVLVFAPRLPHLPHLARHRHADLFLDTFAYNAHTTASDALWAGLPLVTRIGEQFAARVAASILTAAGLPELITRSDAEYEALALALARNPARLAALRTKLAAGKASAPLFDSRRYTRHLEAAYEAAHKRRIDGKPPAPIRIAPDMV